jgi:hypothetical protein
MHNKVLTVARRNNLEEAEAKLQEKIDALGAEWEVVSSQTTGIPYVGGQGTLSGPYEGNHHIMYIVTAALKKVN